MTMSVILRLIPPPRIDQAIGAAGAFGPVCFCWLILGRFLQISAGFITAFMGTFLTASAGCCMSWRTEKGVWMLALFIGGVALLFYLFFVAMGIRDAIRGATSGVSITIEGAIGVAVFRMSPD